MAAHEPRHTCLRRAVESVSVKACLADAVEASFCIDAVGVYATSAVVRLTLVKICIHTRTVNPGHNPSRTKSPSDKIPRTQFHRIAGCYYLQNNMMITSQLGIVGGFCDNIPVGNSGGILSYIRLLGGGILSGDFVRGEFVRLPAQFRGGV